MLQTLTGRPQLDLLGKGIDALTRRGYTFDGSLTTKSWNADPTTGEQADFPTSSSPQSYQVITIQGSQVIELTTSSGLFIWLPAWLEKVMVWHIPTDSVNKTFGTPVRIDYSIDADQFYERYRVVCAMFKLQAGTVSVNNAALAGNINGVNAYNSLASLVGNNSTVFQIYSYENAPGLSPDVESKIVGVQSWNGVSMIFINSPDAQVQRLEDSVVFTPQSLDVSKTTAKFVNDTDSYNLCVQGQVEADAGTFSLPVNGVKRTSLGQYLKDGVRAAPISWSASGQYGWTGIGPTGFVNGVKVRNWLGYELEDITGTIVKSGVLYKDDFILPVNIPNSETLLQDWARSGACPDNLNIAEDGLVSPIRQVNFFHVLENISQENLEVQMKDFQFSVVYPVVNGLTHGIIQEPKLIFYAGAEVGTKLNISGAVRVEAYPDAVRSKFVSNKHRLYDPRTADAIKRVLADPASYGVRWALATQTYEGLIEGFSCGVLIAKEEDPAVQFAAILEQMMRVAKQSTLKRADDTVMQLTHEASIKSLARKAIKSLKHAGTEAYEHALKPLLQEEWENMKKLPQNAAKSILTQTFGPLMAEESIYKPPQVRYQTPPNNVVTVATPRAAAGFMASTNQLGRKGRYMASTLSKEEFELSEVKSNKRKIQPCMIMDETTIRPTKKSRTLNKYLQTPYLAAMSIKEFKRTLASTPKKFEVQTFIVPYNKCNIFVTVNMIEGKLAQGSTQTVADGFAIVPLTLIKSANLDVPIYNSRQKRIFNYSLYNHADEPLKILPNEDVALLRIRSINPMRGVMEVETTSKPVGGRSLELAIYMFNNGIHGLTCFTGGLDNGKILPMHDSMALIKREWCNSNGLMTAGNGNFDIRAETLVQLLTTMRRMTTQHFSLDHYNAAFWHDLRKYDIPEFQKLQPNYTPQTTVSYYDTEGFDPIFKEDCPFLNTDDVIRVTALEGSIPEGVSKHPVYLAQNADNPLRYDYYFLPSIKSRHLLQKYLLQEKWRVPEPASNYYVVSQSESQGIPTASSSQTEPLQQRLTSKRRRQQQQQQQQLQQQQQQQSQPNQQQEQQDTAFTRGRNAQRSRRGRGGTRQPRRTTRTQPQQTLQPARLADRVNQRYIRYINNNAQKWNSSIPDKIKNIKKFSQLSDNVTNLEDVFEPHNYNTTLHLSLGKDNDLIIKHADKIYKKFMTSAEKMYPGFAAFIQAVGFTRTQTSEFLRGLRSKTFDKLNPSPYYKQGFDSRNDIAEIIRKTLVQYDMNQRQFYSDNPINEPLLEDEVTLNRATDEIPALSKLPENELFEEGQ